MEHHTHSPVAALSPGWMRMLLPDFPIMQDRRSPDRSRTCIHGSVIRCSSFELQRKEGCGVVPAAGISPAAILAPSSSSLLFRGTPGSTRWRQDSNLRQGNHHATCARCLQHCRGEEGIRTLNIRYATPALYQLSYNPKILAWSGRDSNP